MKPFTFDRFDSKDHGRPDALSSDRDIFPELPIEWLPQKDALIVQAGFDPTVTDHIGIFSRQWKNHPRGSVVVATDWNFLPGQPYAISREQI